MIKEKINSTTDYVEKKAYPYIAEVNQGGFPFCAYKVPGPGVPGYNCALRKQHTGPHESWTFYGIIYRWYTDSSALVAVYD